MVNNHTLHICFLFNILYFSFCSIPYFSVLYCIGIIRWIHKICWWNRRRMLWEIALGLQLPIITGATLWALGCLNLPCFLWHNESNVLLRRRHKISTSSCGWSMWFSNEVRIVNFIMYVSFSISPQLPPITWNCLTSVSAYLQHLVIPNWLIGQKLT